MLKTSENVEKSADEREELAFGMRAVLMHGDLSDGTVSVPRATLAVWARRVEECEWGDGVIRAPRGSDDVPLLLGDWVRRKGDGVTGEVRRISYSRERDECTTTVEIHTTRLGTVFCAPCDLEHAPDSPQERIRDWVRRAQADEHMDLRELTDIANDMDAEAF